MRNGRRLSGFRTDESHPAPHRPAGGDSRPPAADLPAAGAAVRRLLARLGDVSDPLVVVGYNFTQDAVAVLQEAHAAPFAVSGFRWSDARWRAIRRR